MTINKIVRTPESEQIPGIMSEMRQAADQFLEIGYGVSVFGSARIHQESPYYAIAQEIGARLAKAGITVIAGGGPGIMEAANRGAFETGGKSVGLNIRLPRETGDNPFQTHSLHFEHFSSRKATFFSQSLAYIVLPGGFGTLDELFEVITLVQTKKIPRVPIVMVGTSYWAGLIDWIKDQALAHKLISAHDLDIFTLCDDIDSIMRQIETSCGHYTEDTNVAV